MLLPYADHEHSDDELLEPVSTLALVGTILWLVPALLVTAPVAALASLFARPAPAFADPLREPGS